jgi:hypothetical protein
LRWGMGYISIAFRCWAAVPSGDDNGIPLHRFQLLSCSSLLRWEMGSISIAFSCWAAVPSWDEKWVPSP